MAFVEASIGNVASGFGEGAESWRGVFPSHGEDERNGDEWGEPVVRWQDYGELDSVFGAQMDAVEAIFDVVLGHVHGTMVGVRVSNVCEEAVKGPPELH